MRRTLNGVLGVVLAVVMTGFTLVARPAAADVGDVGYEGPSFSGVGAGPHPSGTKPESKLWWNDGIWWGDLYDPVSTDFHIFRLDTATQQWIDTGVPLDDRPNSRADTLWDGVHLYVASHHFSESPAVADPSRLYRFSYSKATKRYSLDSGFPVVINDYKTETLVIDKDSTGKLWATWVQDTLVYVNRTTTDDAHWGTPFILPVAGVSVNIDDISSVVAMSNGMVGIMWSNQNTAAMYFAVHVDGTPDDQWQASRTALIGSKSADDHINLKSVHADATGRVYAVTKTSFTTSSAPLIMLLVRDPVTGDWASYVVARVVDSHTRPIVLINEEDRTIHVFATGPQPPSTSGQSGGEIYEKTSSMDNISFPIGYGTPVIRDANAADENDVTSTKQNVNSTTGMVVLASNGITLRYWHAYETFTPPLPPAPSASFTASPTSGAVPLDVHFTDTSTGSPTSWLWNFGDGSTSTEQNPIHTYSAVGTFDVTLRATNAGGSTTATARGLIQTALVAPAPSASFLAAPTSGTVPLSVQFTDTSTGSPTSWSWNFGDGGTSTAQHPAHTYTTAGSFNVSLTVTGAGGSDTVTAPGMIQTALPPAPTPSFTWTPASGTAPLSVQFTDTSTGSPTAWSWDFGDNTTSTSQNPTHIYQTAGTYNVSLTVSNLGGQATVTQNAAVSVAPAPTVLTFTPTADAYVAGTKPTTNYGKANNLKVRSDTSTTPFKTYIKFSVTGVTRTVVGAKLRLWVTDGSLDGGTVYTTSSAWSESKTTTDGPALTWSTAPAAGGAVGSAGAVTTGTWIEIDLGTFVSADSTYSFVLTSASTNAATYTSREGVNKPQLVLTEAPL